MIDESEKTPFHLAMERCKILEEEIQRQRNLINDIAADLVDYMPNSYKNCTVDSYEKVKADIIKKIYTKIGTKL